MTVQSHADEIGMQVHEENENEVGRSHVDWQRQEKRKPPIGIHATPPDCVMIDEDDDQSKERHGAVN
jgi:hypothetical protein